MEDLIKLGRRIHGRPNHVWRHWLESWRHSRGLEHFGASQLDRLEGFWSLEGAVELVVGMGKQSHRCHRCGGRRQRHARQVRVRDLVMNGRRGHLLVSTPFCTTVWEPNLQRTKDKNEIMNEIIVAGYAKDSALPSFAYCIHFPQLALG